VVAALDVPWWVVVGEAVEAGAVVEVPVAPVLWLCVEVVEVPVVVVLGVVLWPVVAGEDPVVVEPVVPCPVVVVALGVVVPARLVVPVAPVVLVAPVVPLAPVVAEAPVVPVLEVGPAGEVAFVEPVAAVAPIAPLAPVTMPGVKAAVSVTEDPEAIEAVRADDDADAADPDGSALTWARLASADLRLACASSRLTWAVVGSICASS
jgi:hypothetical protein